MIYPAVFSWDGKNYQMYIPDITGANAISEGNNLDQALRVLENVSSEILSKNYQEYSDVSTFQQVQLDLLEKDDFIVSANIVFTKGKNVKVTLSMPDYVLETIDIAAKREQVSRSAYLANLALGR